MIELDGYTIQLMQEAARNQAEYYEELKRPSMMLKPHLSIDGNQWCALYGESLQDGNAGFGDTPELAYRDFDKNWFHFNINKPKAIGSTEPTQAGQALKEATNERTLATTNLQRHQNR